MQQRLAGAVRFARHGEARKGEALVDQAPDEVLRVSDLVARVGEVQEVVRRAVRYAQAVALDDVAQHGATGSDAPRDVKLMTM
jgi:type VI protein secretion system component VasF